MKIFEILTEATVGKAAMDYKRSNRYPDGEDIPESLPPRYQPASFPGVPANQKCSNCSYYDTDTKKCSKFKGDPVVRPSYWCLKWELYKEEINEDWQKANKKDKTDGMSSKAVKAYRRENPGSKLKTAVTTKPSKLKKGSKDAKRRKSFCARMSGNKGPMKDEKGRPTPKAKALSRWNC